MLFWDLYESWLFLLRMSLSRLDFKDTADNSTDPKPFPQNLVATLLASLQGLLNGTRQPLWEVAAQVLGAVLGSKQFRSALWKEEHCISGSAVCSKSMK
jgi:hypothetical protein